MTKDEALKMAKDTLVKYGSANDEVACAIVQTIRCIDEALEQPKDDTEFWDKLQSEVDENGY